MGKIPHVLVKLYLALGVVQNHARQQANHHAAQIGGKPLYGWTQQKHDDYHHQQLAEANTAHEWVSIQIMRINPD